MIEWIILGLLSTIHERIWQIVIISLPLIGMKMYSIIGDQDKETKLLKYMKANSYLFSVEKHAKGVINPDGYTFGKWYIAFISIGTADRDGIITTSISLVCTESMFNKMIKEDETIDVIKPEAKFSMVDKSKAITHYVNCNGNFYKRSLYIRLKTPSSYQKIVFDNIDKVYKENDGVCIVYLHGQKETGKTGLAYLYAKRFEGCSFLNNYDPTDSCSFDYLLTCSANPTYDSPLIILFDEVDRMLEKVHKDTITPVKDTNNSYYYKKDIKDKRTWNQFFDRLNYASRGVIIFMTSNTSIDDMINNKLDGDGSYLRDGRVNLIVEMYKDKDPNITYLENPIIKYNRMFDNETKIKED